MNYVNVKKTGIIILVILLICVNIIGYFYTQGVMSKALNETALPPEINSMDYIQPFNTQLYQQISKDRSTKIMYTSNSSVPKYSLPNVF